MSQEILAPTPRLLGAGENPVGFKSSCWVSLVISTFVVSSWAKPALPSCTPTPAPPSGESRRWELESPDVWSTLETAVLAPPRDGGP